MRKNALIARKQGVFQDYLTCEKAEKEDKYQIGLAQKAARKRAKNSVNSQLEQAVLIEDSSESHSFCRGKSAVK